jgi:hypothetical protein
MKTISRFGLCALLLCVPAFAQVTGNSGFRTVTVDAGEVTGEIRSFQGLNGPPSPVMPGLPNLARQYKDLRIAQVRTHDFMGPTEIEKPNHNISKSCRFDLATRDCILGRKPAPSRPPWLSKYTCRALSFVRPPWVAAQASFN